jgi:hypothetical protein
VDFADDGRQAFWLEAESWRPIGPVQLVTVDLDSPAARPRPTAIGFPHPPQHLVLRDGRVGSLSGDRLLLHDLADGRLLATATVAQRFNSQLAITADGKLRFYTAGPAWEQGQGPRAAVIEVYELAPGAALRFVGRSPTLPSVGFLALRPDAARIVVRTALSPQGPPQRVVLLDGSDGSLIGEYGAGVSDPDTHEVGARDGTPPADRTDHARNARAVFLADGRLAVPAGEGGGRSLTVVSPTGAVERTVHFPGAAHLRLGAQPAPDQIYVSLAAARDVAWRAPYGWRTVLLDLTSGVARPVGGDLVVMADPWSGPEATGSRLLRSPAGLVLVDAGGRQRTVLALPGAG